MKELLYDVYCCFSYLLAAGCMLYVVYFVAGILV